MIWVANAGTEVPACLTSKDRIRFPEGMTERKARARTEADPYGITARKTKAEAKTDASSDARAKYRGLPTAPRRERGSGRDDAAFGGTLVVGESGRI
jgi:hypothetical protein